MKGLSIRYLPEHLDPELSRAALSLLILVVARAFIYPS